MIIIVFEKKVKKLLAKFTKFKNFRTNLKTKQQKNSLYLSVELADAAQQEEAPNPPDLQQAEVGFDDCLFAQPCRNGATCKSGPHGFSFECICAPGYTGKTLFWLANVIKLNSGKKQPDKNNIADIQEQNRRSATID